MSRRTAVVYFYMIGCPHCEHMRPAWNDAKKKMKGMEVKEKESREVESDDGVQSFPTVVLYKNGKETKRIEGARDKGSQILSELNISKRRNTLRRSSYRGKRKTRNRTLRNYKALA